MNCPTCDYPMVWSTDRERMWCSVYGDHFSPRPLFTPHPVVATIIEHETGRRPRLTLVKGKAS